MGKRVLILDDDDDFNQMLSNIFVHSGYEVTSERDPETALESFKNNSYDLVVTDQKMPGLTGEEFAREIRKEQSNFPFIVMSGYLDNETVRNFVKLGVGGIFLKPLNVFSLLKHASALLERPVMGPAVISEADDTLERPEDYSAYQQRLPFSMKTFPCKAAKSHEFAKKLYGLREFKSNLLLIGPEGTDFEGIVDDLISFDVGLDSGFSLLNTELIAKENLEAIADEAIKEGSSSLTLALTEIKTISEETKTLLFQFAKAEGVFSGMELMVRYIFCLNKDVDTLYECGEIDDDLYMFMGTSEVRIPSLRDIREDIPIMADAYLRKQAEEMEVDPLPRFDSSAGIFIHQREWKHEVADLKSFIQLVLKADLGPVITRKDLESVLADNSCTASPNPSGGLFTELRQSRDDYVRAVHVLTGLDRQATKTYLGVSSELVDGVLDSDTAKSE